MSGRRLVAVDLGTHRVRCAIAEDEGARLKVLGVGEVDSKGVSRGVVADPDQAVSALSKALDAAERAAGMEVEAALLSLGGRHVRSQPSRAQVTVASRSGAVSGSDLNRVLEAARDLPGEEGTEVVHLIPRWYTVDDNQRVRDPRGVAGSRLAVDSELVLASVAHLEALVECAHSAGLRVDDLVVQPLAAAEGVVRDSELEESVAVVDVGAGTTDIATFWHGTLEGVRVLPVGGQHVTADLAVGLRCGEAEAESLKRRHGHCDPARVLPEELVRVVGPSGVGADEVSRRVLAEIIEPRAREIVRLIGQALEGPHAPAKVVLTGGGSCLRGFPEAVHQLLELPVRVALPEGLTGLSDQLGMPEHATIAGLLRWGQRSGNRRDHSSPRAERSSGRLNRWLHELF